MKFVCPNCKAKYQIADEKIQGRTLKMDCRRCSTSITIRGDLPQQVDDIEEARPASVRPPAASASASRRPAGAATGGSSVGAAPTRGRPGHASGGSAPGASQSSLHGGSLHGGPLHGALGADFRRGSLAPENRPAPERPSVLDQWHVAINDVPVGPMRREEITRKIATGAVHAESLAWREGFDDWRPVRDIPELAALLRRAEPVRPDPAPGRGLPAPRAGLATAGSRLAAASPSRLGGGAGRPQPAAAAARSTASPATGGNVVPIGGRMGGAAPALDAPIDEEDEQEEATQIASAADLGLLAMEPEPAPKPAPEKARMPAPAPPRKDPTGATKGARPAPPEPAKPAAKAPAAPVKAPDPVVAAPAEKSFTTEDGLPPLIDGRPSTPFAAPPAAVPAPAPLPIAATAPVAEPEPRRRGLGPGAMMGIAGAVAFGAVFAFVAAQRMFPATTPTAPAVATVTPPPAPAPAAPEVEIDPPVATETTAPAVEEPPAAPVPAGGAATGGHHTGGARPPASGGSTGAGAAGANKALTGDFARFAEEGGPAPIEGGATTRRLGDEGARAGAELTSDQIAHVVTRERTGLQRCWETAIRGLRETPTVRIDVDLTIGSSGTVTNAAARGPAVGTLSDCIERSVRRWRFPASSGTSRTSFPVVFSGTS